MPLKDLWMSLLAAALGESLALKSIRLLTQLAPDLLACQFAMPNWVQLNCDLAVANVTMWPDPLAQRSPGVFPPIMLRKANYRSPWTWMSTVVSVPLDHGSGLVDCRCWLGQGPLNQCRLQETTQLSPSLTVALFGTFAVTLIQLHCPYIISGHLCCSGRNFEQGQCRDKSQEFTSSAETMWGFYLFILRVTPAETSHDATHDNTNVRTIWINCQNGLVALSQDGALYISKRKRLTDVINPVMFN